MTESENTPAVINLTDDVSVEKEIEENRELEKAEIPTMTALPSGLATKIHRYEVPIVTINGKEYVQPGGVKFFIDDVQQELAGTCLGLHMHFPGQVAEGFVGFRHSDAVPVDEVLEHIINSAKPVEGVTP